MFPVSKLFGEQLRVEETGDSGLETVDCGLYAGDCRLEPVDCKRETVDCRPETVDSRLKTFHFLILSSSDNHCILELLIVLLI